MTDDLISRAAAIAYAISGRVRTLPTTEDGENWIRTEEVRQSLLTMPSAQQWIPCSERLPAKTGHYLCSFKKPNRIDNIFVDLAYWTGGRWYGYLANEINAWMPLPEPYEVKHE